MSTTDTGDRCNRFKLRNKGQDGIEMEREGTVFTTTTSQQKDGNYKRKRRAGTKAACVGTRNYNNKQENLAAVAKATSHPTRKDNNTK